MHDIIEQKIKTLPDLNAPEGMHERIMKKISRAQWRTPFLVTLSLLGLNVMISGWHVWSRMDELDSMAIFRALMESFAWTTDFVQDFTATLPQFLPLPPLTIFLINVVLVTYGTYLYRGMRRMPAG